MRMLIDTAHWQFWLMGLLWFTAPILSWLWSLVAIKHYKQFASDAKKMSASLAAIHTYIVDDMNADSTAYRQSVRAEQKDVQDLKDKAQQELEYARDYYTRIKDILEQHATLEDEDL